MTGRQRLLSGASWLLPLLPIAAILVSWELAARSAWVNPTLASMPSRVASAGVRMLVEGPLLSDIVATGRLLLVAYAASIALGLLLGLFSGAWRLFEYGLNPFVWFFYNAPIVAFIPLFILWFGIGSPTIFALALLFGFFPIYVNTIAGIENVDPMLVRLGRSLCLSSRQMATKVVLPAALPMIFAGLRLAMGRVFVGVIVGEIFAGSRWGLGFRLRNATDRLRTDEAFAALLVIMIIGVAIGLVLRRFDARLSAWRTAGR